jgi:hypothetical protein
MNTNNSNKSHIWTESIWVTRKENCTLKVGDDVVTREFSIGLTVKSDDRSPSSVLYEKLDAALEALIACEKEKWLNDHKMRSSQGEYRSAIQQIDDLVTGKSDVKSQASQVQPSTQPQPSPRKSGSPVRAGALHPGVAPRPVSDNGNRNMLTDDIPF